jgi:hypothetical protein
MKTLLHAGTFICAFNMCVKLTSKFEFKYLIFKLRIKKKRKKASSLDPKPTDPDPLASIAELGTGADRRV